MKINNKYLIASLISCFFLVGCYEEPSELTQPFNDGGGELTFPTISSVNSSFFDSFDFANAYVEFVVDVDVAKVESITIEKSFNGEKTILETFSSFPATVKVTASDAVEDISGVSVEDLEVGDTFTFEIVTNHKNGLSTRANSGILNATVACKSSIAGVYTTVTSGQSTDPGPTENPIVDHPYEVTLTDTGVNGVYTISDYSAGVYTTWYDIYGLSGDYPGTIQDVCNSVTAINTTGPFGSPISGSGSIDPDTGVITISGGAVLWGDTWTMVLTPKD